MAREQSATVRRILSEPLPQEPAAAFKDLVYAIDTAVLLDLSSEESVMPMLHDLFGIRRKLDAQASPRLRRIQDQLGNLILAGD